MTDFLTIFKIEEAIEPAVAAVLNGATGQQALGSFATDIEQIPRYEVLLEVGEQVHNDHQAMIVVGGKQVRQPDCWHCVLVIRCVSNRTKGGFQQQAEMRSYARYVFMPWRDSFPALVLPFHELAINREIGTTLNMILGEDEDVSETRFECWVTIRDGAWPAS